MTPSRDSTTWVRTSPCDPGGSSCLRSSPRPRLPPESLTRMSSSETSPSLPESRPPSRVPPGKRGEYALAVITSWLLPGAGHWILGHRVRAVILASAILGIFWSGQALAHYRAVNKTDHPIFFSAQVANGLSTLLSEKYWGQPRPRTDRIDKEIAPHHSTGILFTSISGLLNALLVLHVADPRTWSGRALELAKAPGESGD